MGRVKKSVKSREAATPPHAQERDLAPVPAPNALCEAYGFGHSRISALRSPLLIRKFTRHAKPIMLR